LNQPLPDFSGEQDLTFQKPDLEKFPCLALAFQACKVGKTMPAVLNAANEMAVKAFLHKKISFTDIAKAVSLTMEAHDVGSDPQLSDIIAADQWARQKAQDFIEAMQA